MSIDFKNIKDLIKLANSLDDKGHYREADEIDRFINSSLSISKIASTNPEDYVNEPLLKWGSRGESVKRLQNALNSLMQAGLIVDGVFGENTYNAVIAFQASKGLKQDGVVGKNTYAALNWGGSLRPDSTVPTPTTPTDSPAPAPAPSGYSRSWAREVVNEAQRAGRAGVVGARADVAAAAAAQAQSDNRMGRATRQQRRYERLSNRYNNLKGNG